MATDYEKKYKEALERAKKMMKSKRKVVVEKQALETIFPELAESEDERIRKELVEAFEALDIDSSWNGIPVKSILAWLEKQKEKFEDISTVLLVKKEIERRIETWQESRKEFIAMECNTLADDAAVRIEELYSLISFLGTIRCNLTEKQKEHQNNSDAPNESSWSGMISSSDKDKNLDEIAQDYVDGVKEYNPEPTWDLIQTAVCYGYHYCEQKEQKPVDYETELKKCKDNPLYFYDKYVSIKQKPAEWSEDYREEDIQTRFAFYTYKDDPSTLYLSNVFVEEASRNHGFGTRILRAAEKVAETVGATTISLKVKQNSPANAWYRKNGYGYVAFEDGYDWLEKNLEYLKPNKQEWSEEGKRKLNRIYEIIGQAADEQPFGSSKRIIGDKEAVELQDFIKSLRPQPKVEWDTHDKAIVTCIACCLDGQFVSEAARKKCLEWFNKHRRDFLNSPSWKPSEQ